MKFSILISSFNKGKYIRKCITSCLNQKEKNFEVILYDNFSEDNTSTDPVINHAIIEIENLGIKFKYISLVQATYPFLDVEHIKEVIAGFKKPFDCAFGAAEKSRETSKRCQDRPKTAQEAPRTLLKPS